MSFIELYLYLLCNTKREWEINFLDITIKLLNTNNSPGLTFFHKFCACVCVREVKIDELLF